MYKRQVLKDLCDSLKRASKKQGIKTEVDYANVRAMLAHDRRIGDAWLDIEHGGYRGYGGYCFVKDTRALISSGQRLLKKLPVRSVEYARLQAGLKLLKSMRGYNRALLASQGLTEEDVAVHDHEWIRNKLRIKNDK